jgi:hypothetical protein
MAVCGRRFGGGLVRGGMGFRGEHGALALLDQPAVLKWRLKETARRRRKAAPTYRKGTTEELGEAERIAHFEEFVGFAWGYAGVGG